MFKLFDKPQRRKGDNKLFESITGPKTLKNVYGLTPYGNVDEDFTLLRDDLNTVRAQYDSIKDEIHEIEDYNTQCRQNVRKNMEKMPLLVSNMKKLRTIGEEKKAALAGYARMRRSINKGTFNPDKAPVSKWTYLGYSNDENIRKMLADLSVPELTRVRNKLTPADEKYRLISSIINQRKEQSAINVRNYMKQRSQLQNSDMNTPDYLNALNKKYFSAPKFRFDLANVEKNAKLLTVYNQVKDMIMDNMDLTTNEKNRQLEDLRNMYRYNKEDFIRIYTTKKVQPLKGSPSMIKRQPNKDAMARRLEQQGIITRLARRR